MRTVLRVLLTLVLAFGLIGFGTCSMIGISVTAHDPQPVVLVLSLLGILITAVCAYAIYAIWFRKKS